ncbi:unnamed protein product [Auanema sp. JU1783]|nr:unnamed protein product [Auanema sp. JU1783]
MTFVFRKIFFFKALCLVVALIVSWCELLVYMHHARYCGEVWRRIQRNSPDELNAIMISDTHILGNFKGHWFDKLRREWQMSKSFEMSLRYMQPDVVFFLGDLMDEGKWTNENLFNEYADRFFTLFNNKSSGVPMYFVPGNHDLGFHYEMHPERIKWFKKRFNVDPVELHVIKEHTFVLINSMALHGDNCTLCSEGTHLIEKYSKVLSCAASNKCFDKEAAPFKPYNRPILLQHFPLFRLDENICLRDEDFDEMAPDRDEVYREKWECLSQDSSNYLLAKFTPRAVFNGHAHRGCKREWSTPVSFVEYTMNSFNWRNNDVPTVLMVTINREEVKTKVCYLPSEKNIIACYIFLAECDC